MSANQANRKRMLGIVGSPRRGGNTEILVDEVLRGAEEAGALVEKVILSKLNIAPCRACDTCRKAGQCAQRDDMPALLEKMELSQVWVLGTPVYWWGPTAQFKAFFDRWYGAGEVVPFRDKRVILVIPLEASDAGVARHLVGMLRDSLDWVGAKLLAVVVAPGVGEAGIVRGNEAIMAEARRAGRAAVRA